MIKPFVAAIATRTPFRHLVWIGLGVSLALWPSPVLANAGTALMWTSIVHLFVGNFILGYVEARLLSRLFHAPREGTIEIVVMANYVSAWTGVFLLMGRLSRHPSITIENVQVWLAIATILAFVLTLVVEYPFFWFVLRQHKGAIQTAIKATLLLHGISYLLLFGWYSLNSQTSFITQLNLVPAAQLQPNPDYSLYFLTPDRSQVLRSELNGANPEVGDRHEFEVLTSATEPMFGSVPPPKSTTDWEFQVHPFAGGGITGYNRATQTRLHLAMETPFALWPISYVTHLPEDWLVFQLGQDQICLLHPDTRRIALIARGKHPVVTVEDESS